MIKREAYFSVLNGYRDKPFIKVLTGLRRVGKSTLLDLFIENLMSQGVKHTNILKINFELPNSFDLMDYKSLTDYVLKYSIGKSGLIYLF